MGILNICIPLLHKNLKMINLKNINSSLDQIEFELLSQKIDLATNNLSDSYFSILLSNDKNYLNKKKNAYTSILENHKHTQGLYHIYNGYLTKQLQPQDNKTNVLNEIIFLLDQAVESNKYFLIAQITHLESQLYEELDSWEKYLIDDYFFLELSVGNSSYGQFLESYSDIKTNLNFLRNKLFLLVKKRVHKAAFDIRNTFRNIIQFLFKNMDDENDSYTSLNKYSLNVFNNYQINFNYVKTRNHCSFTDYYKQFPNN